MTRTFFLLCNAIFLHCAAHGQIFVENSFPRDKYSLVRVCDTSFLATRFGLAAEGIVNSGTCVEFTADEAAVAQIRAAGFNAEIVIADLSDFYATRAAAAPVPQIASASGFRLGSMGGYLTLNEIYEEFARMREAFPAAVSAPHRIGTSVENRPIFAYRISLASETDSVPETLFTALHHAREPGSVTALTYFLWNYLEKGNKSYENDFLLHNRSIWCIPALNPDGYEFNRSTNPGGGGLWRKNRKQIGRYWGVDLNRNYGPYKFWDANNDGSSSTPIDETYRGDAPFSEPETQAIRDFVATRQFSTALNYHTYGNVCIYPFSYSGRETSDSLLFRNYGAEITRHNSFSLGRDMETLGYGIRGGSDDYFYDTGMILSITPETGSSSDGFWARPDRIETLAAENLYANYQAVWSSGVNLRPIETETEWKNDTSAIERITIINVGRRTSPAGVIARLLTSENISIEKQDFALPELKPSESVSANWQIIIKPHIAGSSQNPPILEIEQEGIRRSDTLHRIIGRPKILTLFADSSDIVNWNAGNWGVRRDGGTFSLADSPYGFYRPNSLNAAVYGRSIDLRNANAACLRFRAKWSLIFKKDAVTVEVSVNEGRSWERLYAGRMRTDANLPDTLGGGNGPAFKGNFPIWETQECLLNKFCGKEILLRFVLAAEQGYAADGIAVQNVRIEIAMPDIPRIADDFSTFTADFFSLPRSSGVAYISAYLTNAQIPKGTPIEAEIYNALGSRIYNTVLPASGGNETILELPTADWTQGLYFATVRCGGQAVYGRIIVMR